jgi:hypothetical protein
MPATITSIDLDRQLAAAGAAADSFARLWRSLWTQPYIPAGLLELCRLTLARLHQDREELAALNPYLPEGAPAPQTRELVLAGRVGGSALFSGFEKAVLEFAEVYGLDAQSLTDELAHAVSRHIGEPGLVFLIEALGCLDARIRGARCLRDLAAAGHDAHAR